MAAIAGRAFEDDVALCGSVAPEFSDADVHRHFIEEAHYIAVMWEDEIVGGVCAIPRDEGTSEVGIIFVEPRFQRRGIGALALDFIERQFPADVTWVLDTGHLNTRNHRFYKKMGHRVVGFTDPDPAGVCKLIFQKP